MDLAIDLRDEGLVAARDAKRGPGYLCPHCCAQVHLRRGRAKVAHFAHNRGEGDPECELYHPGASMYGMAGDPLADGGMPLYLHLNSDDHRWTMFIEFDVLSIEESRTTAYALLFFDGLTLNRPGERSRTLSVDALSPESGRNRMTVAPSRENSSLRMSGSWPRSIRSKRWQRTLAGLPRVGAVFVKFRGGAFRRFDWMTPVFWGDSIVVVRPDAEAPPGLLSPVQLGSVSTAAGTWHAWRVVLPTEARRAVVDWLAAFGVVVEQRRSRTRLITPAVEYGGDGIPLFLLDEPVVVIAAKSAKVLIAESNATISAVELPSRHESLLQRGLTVTAIESGPLRLRTDVHRDAVEAKVVTETSAGRDTFVPVWSLRYDETPLAPFRTIEEASAEAEIVVDSELVGLTFTACVYGLDGRVETLRDGSATQISGWLQQHRENAREIEVDAGNLGFVRLIFDTASPSTLSQNVPAPRRRSNWATAYAIAADSAGDTSEPYWRSPCRIRPDHASIVGSWL